MRLGCQVCLKGLCTCVLYLYCSFRCLVSELFGQGRTIYGTVYMQLVSRSPWYMSTRRFCRSVLNPRKIWTGNPPLLSSDMQCLFELGHKLLYRYHSKHKNIYSPENPGCLHILLSVLCSIQGLFTICQRLEILLKIT